MFTWIITHQWPIIHTEWWTYTIKNPFNTLPTIGQSIAHDGACMSITTVDATANTYSFFAMTESLNKTNFWKKTLWSSFNLERCIQAHDRLDGHFVTGHIDTTGEVIAVDHISDGSMKVTIRFDYRWQPLLLPKGSIAINGISLTVVDVYEDSFTVWLIPITQQETNLWKTAVWQVVNLEFDMLWKYVLKSQWITLPTAD